MPVSSAAHNAEFQYQPFGIHKVMALVKFGRDWHLLIEKKFIPKNKKGVDYHLFR